MPGQMHVVHAIISLSDTYCLQADYPCQGPDSLPTEDAASIGSGARAFCRILAGRSFTGLKIDHMEALAPLLIALVDGNVVPSDAEISSVLRQHSLPATVEPSSGKPRFVTLASLPSSSIVGSSLFMEVVESTAWPLKSSPHVVTANSYEAATSAAQSLRKLLSGAQGAHARSAVASMGVGIRSPMQLGAHGAVGESTAPPLDVGEGRGADHSYGWHS
jgi:hypothetical protein